MRSQGCISYAKWKKKLIKKCCLPFLSVETFRPPLIFFKVALSLRAENHALLLEHRLLQIDRDGQLTGRTFSLRIDHPLPRNAVVRAVHNITDRSSGVSLAQDDRDLAVGHNLSPWNLFYQIENF